MNSNPWLFLFVSAAGLLLSGVGWLTHDAPPPMRVELLRPMPPAPPPVVSYVTSSQLALTCRGGIINLEETLEGYRLVGLSADGPRYLLLLAPDAKSEYRRMLRALKCDPVRQPPVGQTG